jgi:hypothetical protein
MPADYEETEDLEESERWKREEEWESVIVASISLEPT